MTIGKVGEPHPPFISNFFDFARIWALLAHEWHRVAPEPIAQSVRQSINIFVGEQPY